MSGKEEEEGRGQLVAMEEGDTPLLKPGQDSQTEALQRGEDGREKTAGTPDVPYLQTKPPSAGPKIPGRSLAAPKGALPQRGQQTLA